MTDDEIQSTLLRLEYMQATGVRLIDLSLVLPVLRALDDEVERLRADRGLPAPER